MSALFFAPAGPVITTSRGVHDISVVRETLAPAREDGTPRTRTGVASTDLVLVGLHQRTHYVDPRAAINLADRLSPARVCYEARAKP